MEDTLNTLEIPQEWLEGPLLSRTLSNSSPYAKSPTPTAPPSVHPRRRRQQLPPPPSQVRNSVTPLIYNLANNHFLCPFCCLGHDVLPPPVDVTGTQRLVDDLLRANKRAKGQVVLGEKLKNSTPEATCYKFVILDGIKFKASILACNLAKHRPCASW